jgi:hypothetical protein
MSATIYIPITGSDYTCVGSAWTFSIHLSDLIISGFSIELSTLSKSYCYVVNDLEGHTNVSKDDKNSMTKKHQLY